MSRWTRAPTSTAWGSSSTSCSAASPLRREDALQSMAKVLETEPVPLLAINLKGVQLARVAHRLMRKEPEARFQTAEEVLEALSE